MDFYNAINLLYATLAEFCTPESCPAMTAGPKFEYRWADGVKVKKPIECSAPEYVEVRDAAALNMSPQGRGAVVRVSERDIESVTPQSVHDIACHRLLTRGRGPHVTLARHRQTMPSST